MRRCKNRSRNGKIRSRPPTVEGLYCKRPIQCLASSEMLTPHPLTPGECVPPRLWCGRRTHSLSGEGVRGQQFGKTPDTDLYSIYVSTLLCASHSVFCEKQYGGLVHEYHNYSQRYECSYFREQREILMKILANCTSKHQTESYFRDYGFFFSQICTHVRLLRDACAWLN